MRFGLLGEKLDYSFSKNYFEQKFQTQNLNHSYSNFEIKNISDFPHLLKREKNLSGLNVTIPFKEAIIPFLDELDLSAKKIGAVNTIHFSHGKLMGFNTDAYGFEKSMEPLWEPHNQAALILGTGGASKAIAYVLEEKGINFKKVSRKPLLGQISYDEAGRVVDQFQIIINTTPLGTFPNVKNRAPLALDLVNSQHIFFDLIYNPLESLFLREAKLKGAKTKNGLEMLELQANKSWDIWNEL